MHITGDLTATNVPALKSFSASDLQTIGGELHLDTLYEAVTLDFPQLATVGTVSLLRIRTRTRSMNFPALDTVGDFTISNTNLPSLRGIALHKVNGGAMVLGNN